MQECSNIRAGIHEEEIAMPKFPAKSHEEAQKLVQLMAQHGAWAQVQRDGRTVEYANQVAWKRVRKQWVQMQVIREAAESKSMMQERELL